MTTGKANVKRASRRRFLKGVSLGLGIPLAAGVLTACGGTPSAQSPTAAPEHDMTTMPQGQSGSMTAEEMDAMHEAGIKAFLSGVKTEGAGNQPLLPKIESGVKIFELTCQRVQWEATPGQKLE